MNVEPTASTLVTATNTVEFARPRTLNPARAAAVPLRRQLVILARKEFTDRLGSGWVVACVLVWLAAVSFTSLFGLAQIGQIGWQGYERTVVSLLNLVQYLVPLLGLLLGHDLIVGEREERTLSLVLASGVSRSRLLLGKFLGGVATLAVPLILGFAIAGVAIGWSSRDRQLGSFLLLAASALVLGIVFLGVGLLLSTLCRTRVRALVATLLVWGGFVFVFDLVALGVVISSQAPAAAQEIEALCDATHLNSSLDIHSAFDTAPNAHAASQPRAATGSLSWVLLNPVDLFRALNLPGSASPGVSPALTGLTVTLWLVGTLGLAAWRLRRLDL